MKRILSCVFAFILVFTLAACGSVAGKYGYEAPDENSIAPSEPGWSEDYGAAEPQMIDKEQPRADKMIYSADIDLETTEFEKAMADLTELVEHNAGYFEERSISGYTSDYRYASLTIRIPAERFDSFCTKAGDVCHTVRMNTAQENVSQSYYDVASRLDTAKTKLARLQELLAKAENMTDIITIEDAISDTEQTIDYLSGNLRGYDNLVDYATVRISVREVYRYSGTKDAPVTLGEKLSNAFSAGLESVVDLLEGIVVFLAYSWLWLLMLAVIAVVVIILVRRGKKRRQVKKAVPVESSRPE